MRRVTSKCAKHRARIPAPTILKTAVILGENFNRIFVVAIEAIEAVNNLREAIKGKNIPVFNHSVAGLFSGAFVDEHFNSEENLDHKS
jgi:hypothetical protein